MRATRAFAAIAVLALVASACGGSTHDRRPVVRGAARRPSRLPGGRRVRRRVGAPATAAIAIGGSTAAPGQIEIRWYCCLGGGDAPEQVDGREEGRRGVQRQPPGHPRDVRGGAVQPAPTTPLATEIASGNGPDIVGPVGIGGANAFHGQWLDLAPLIEKNDYDLSGFPQDASTSTSSTRARSASRSRSTRRRCSTRRACSRRPASRSRRTSTATSTRCPTAPWSTGTTTRSPKVAKLLTVDKNGKDATQAGLRPEEHRPVGLRAPARRPARPGRLLRRRARCAGGRRQDRPDPRRLEGGLEVLLRRACGRTTSSMTGPQSPEQGHQPRGLPVLHRQGRDERELPVVDLRRRRRRRRLGPRRDPVVQRAR